MEVLRLRIASMAEKKHKDRHNCFGPSYQLCLLGACAMTLGARIPEQDRSVMREVYKDVAFMRDAVIQLETALDLDEGYVNGVPWDFGSLGVNDYTAAGGAANEDLMFPGTGMANVRAPDHKIEEVGPQAWESLKKEAFNRYKKHKDEMTAGQVKITLENLEMSQKEADEKCAVDWFIKDLDYIFRRSLTYEKTMTWDKMRAAVPKIMAEMYSDGEDKSLDAIFGKSDILDESQKTSLSELPEDFLPKREEEFSNKVCGNCGTEKRNDGSALIFCGKCRKRRYCGKACQKRHWAVHKNHCEHYRLQAVAYLGASENVDGRSQAAT